MRSGRGLVVQMVGGALIVDSLIVLLGHIVHFEVFTTWNMSPVQMSVPTAMMFIVVGIAFIFSTGDDQR